VALDGRRGEISPYKKPHPQDQFVALLSLLETTTHEVHILIDPLNLLPATLFLRPRLPLIDKILEPGIFHPWMISEVSHLRNLFSYCAALVRRCVGIWNPPFNEDGDLLQKPRLMVQLVKILQMDPVFEYFREGWPGRHALLANLKPEIGEFAGTVSEEGRTALGAILWDLVKP
jgi:hypothetical protein